ncbi:hypothetical protein [Paenibacillus protaetiae]|uniref:hypothetical protein n=1 Tax=Paenibacillus protaetiae TaxID=2509456 RepID=UPI001FCA1041|nr:hypothetical protein [Paenibacillus protaetiae]
MNAAESRLATEKKKGFVFPYRLEWDASRKESPWWMTIVSIVLALVFCGIFIWANGMNPLTVYGKMLNGAFGTQFGITETLVKAIPLLLCGLGVAVAYRISIWNIGRKGSSPLGQWRQLRLRSIFRICRLTLLYRP